MIHNKKIILKMIHMIALLPISVQAGSFLKTIQHNRIQLEQQIQNLTASGDELLKTGSDLHDKLIKELEKVQGQLQEYKQQLQIPYALIVDPKSAISQFIDQNFANNPTLQPLVPTIKNSFNDPLLTKAYQNFWNTLVTAAKIPSLPDVLKNLMGLMNEITVKTNAIRERFMPAIFDLHSFVDIEQAKKDLNLPANSYTFANLEFVNTYKEYVNKIYAQKTGKTFDPRKIYAGLWQAKTEFERALAKLKRLEAFFAKLV